MFIIVNATYNFAHFSYSSSVIGQRTARFLPLNACPFVIFKFLSVKRVLVTFFLFGDSFDRRIVVPAGTIVFDGFGR
jgi:hypothetical protein